MASMLRLIAFALVLFPTLAAAEPITLKLAFFSSHRSHLYLSGATPSPAARARQAKRAQGEEHRLSA